jgi:hypothetical protein
MGVRQGARQWSADRRPRTPLRRMQATPGKTCMRYQARSFHKCHPGGSPAANDTCTLKAPMSMPCLGEDDMVRVGAGSPGWGGGGVGDGGMARARAVPSASPKAPHVDAANAAGADVDAVPWGGLRGAWCVAGGVRHGTWGCRALKGGGGGEGPRPEPLEVGCACGRSSIRVSGGWAGGVGTWEQAARPSAQRMRAVAEVGVWGGGPTLQRPREAGCASSARGASCWAITNQPFQGHGVRVAARISSP